MAFSLDRSISLGPTPASRTPSGIPQPPALESPQVGDGIDPVHVSIALEISTAWLKALPSTAVNEPRFVARTTQSTLAISIRCSSNRECTPGLTCRCLGSQRRCPFSTLLAANERGAPSADSHASQSPQRGFVLQQHTVSVKSCCTGMNIKRQVVVLRRACGYQALYLQAASRWCNN